jgi:nucleoside-diphosphate kinase
MKKERTFVMLKHDAVQRSLIGEVIGRFEKSGLKIAAMKFIVPDLERATRHYGKDDAWCERKGNKTIENLTAAGRPIEKSAIEYGREIVDALLSYITAGPVVMMVLEGSQAVGIVKKLVGGTEPLASDVGTIRGDYTLDSYAHANNDGRAVRNLIHCTDPEDDAQAEIDIWFDPSELVDYRHINEAMLYDVNMDGILG